MNQNEKIFTDNYRMFLDAVDIPVLILNRYDLKTVVYSNQLVEKSFSIDTAQKDYQEFFLDKNLVRHLEYHLFTFPLHQEIEVDERFFILKSTKIFDYIFLFFNEITLIKKNDVIKRRYVDSISHELKTPLTNILLYTEKLQNCSDPNSKKSLDVIYSNAQVLKKLIDDILVLSKLDSNEILITPNIIKLRAMMVDIMKELMPLSVANNVDIEILIPSNLEIYGDKKLLYRAFKNLIENGIRYNTSGGIVIIKSSLEDNNVIISFEDNGIGIEKKDIACLFNRFFRADKGRTKGDNIKDGTGLGLSIVKNVVNQHKGIVEVHSHVGRGSKFKVTLPNIYV
jgi:two-component system phosphate regulon sensor histidine kinase PhoR